MSLPYLRNIKRPVASLANIFRLNVLAHFNLRLSCHLCQQMVHLKSRPHTCDLCGKSFAARAGMDNHIALIHEKQQPFACDRYNFSIV